MSNLYPSYVPDDARITLPALEFLRTPAGASLRTQIATLLSDKPEPSVSDIAALRKHFPPDAVHAALVMGKLQPKASEPNAKFPDLPYVWATPESLEQATHTAVARHKAHRFAQLAPTHIIDFCSGIGGDTLALAAIAPTTAIDLSPIRTACLQFNAHDQPIRHPLQILTQDIQSALPTLPKNALFHLDPARRSAGKRSPRYEDLIPPPEVLTQVNASFPGGALKLSPAVDLDSLPPGHLELITHHHSVVQAVLWLGTLAQSFPPNTRTATILAPQPFSFTATPQLATTSPTVGQYLYEVDGAFTRAHLAQPLASSLNLTALTVDGGYLTSNHLLPPHPALTPFQILAHITPYSERRVLDALRADHAPPGIIEVKTRGRLPQVDTDRLQKVFTAAAPINRTILIFNHQNTPTALIATRLP